jgi:hypothetical protein
MPSVVKGEEIENFPGTANFADVGDFVQEIEDRMHGEREKRDVEREAGRKARKFEAYLR